MAAKCTLPELKEMLTRAKFESTDHVCPEHRIHLVRNGKIRDDLKDIHTPVLIEPSHEVE